MLTITAIETAGPDRRARQLVFSNGQVRLTSAAVLKQLGIEEGETLSCEDLDRLLQPLEADAAKERALRVLGYRERTHAELLKRLLDDGYPEPVASAVVERFSDLGLVDDSRYAHLYARTRASAGYGRPRILRELVTRGIDPDTARTAVDESLVESEAIRARATLRGRVPEDRKERDRALRRLVSRGYGFSDALAALDASADEFPE